VLLPAADADDALRDDYAFFLSFHVTLAATLPMMPLMLLSSFLLIISLMLSPRFDDAVIRCQLTPFRRCCRHADMAGMRRMLMPDADDADARCCRHILRLPLLPTLRYAIDTAFRLRA